MEGELAGALPPSLLSADAIEPRESSQAVPALPDHQLLEDWARLWCRVWVCLRLHSFSQPHHRPSRPPPKKSRNNILKMSNDLEWLLLRKNNSFIVKRVEEGPVFSKEPTIDVRDSESGIQLITRKKGASSHAVRPGFATSTIRPRSGGRRALGVAAKLAKRGYRPDLRAATLARVSALLVAQKEKKPSPPKKVRGKKKTATA
ncbi:uncharacterized protein FIBRA_04861 [Fibroporia radiculosa]|uniref:Ribosomal L28e/Mak16 domain-containing protein n=1 Tax=Fibroporia radiculosa TaxID=599839 RepID=J4G828_9APHY|nr:uncharacterized protein FIBRA_04861 [Fibroporia radiculosa]CCM02753.1 predicted protein [Fibroporia radiculosa]